MVIRIAHLSTAHGRNELRVHLKQCNSLAANNYEVHFVVADGLGDERVGDVQIHDIGRADGRFQRMLLYPWRMLSAARKLNASLYHFHDPEILLIALFLRRGGAKVVYDSHEDVPRSLLSRYWLPSWVRPVLSRVFETFESFVACRLSAVVGAVPKIAARFEELGVTAVAINNYPLGHEIQDVVPSRGTSRNVCYLGLISRVRGIEEIVRALEFVDTRLILAGPIESAATEQAMRALPGWAKVDYRGKVSRAEVREIMAESQAGLILFHPEPNHISAQPNKMYEYMSSGLPVLGSDFPLWREIVEGAGCGLLVDPQDPEAIAEAMQWIINHPEEAAAMGRRGHAAVEERYNWDAESKKLVALYRYLLPDS